MSPAPAGGRAIWWSSGGGFGGMVRGIGAYSISNGQARFIPAIATTALALTVTTVARARRRRQWSTA